MIELLLAFTLHVNAVKDFNEVHPHVRYAAENGLVVGVYQDSFYNYNPYVAYRAKHENFFAEGGMVIKHKSEKKIDELGFFSPFARVGYSPHSRVDVFISAYNVKKEPKPLLGIEFKLLSF